MRFPALRKLCFQRLHIVMTEAPVLPERPGSLVECGQSQGRYQPTSSSECKTLIPQGLLFETSLGREVLGFERLRIMGMNVGPALEASFGNTFFSSLSGNAFDCNCCALAMMAGFAALGASDSLALKDS